MALIYVVLPPSIHPLPPTEFVWELVMVSFYCLYFYKISFPKYFEGMIQKNFSNFTKFFSVFFSPYHVKYNGNLLPDIVWLC